MAKNDLSQFKKKGADNSKNSLPSNDKPKPQGVGRKAKPKAEKASKPITLKFTERELELIEAQSGLIPNATYLKQLLITQTDLFKNVSSLAK